MAFRNRFLLNKKINFHILVLRQKILNVFSLKYIFHTYGNISKALCPCKNSDILKSNWEERISFFREDIFVFTIYIWRNPYVGLLRTLKIFNANIIGTEFTEYGFHPIKGENQTYHFFVIISIIELTIILFHLLHNYWNLYFYKKM